MKNKILNLSILAVSILTSVVAFFYLPDQVASHWNYLGAPDGYSSKLSTLILFPALLVFMYLLLVFIPQLDPMKKNIAKFNDQFSNFISIMLLFFVLVQYQVLLWNLGVQIPFNLSFPILLGGLFYFIGTLLEKSKRNWTIGIRTPWTLSSDKVWDATHKKGAKLFKISPLVFFLSIFLPNDFTFGIVIGYLLGTVIFLFVYSYLLFKKEQK
ncbi:MAG TPA: SdpI family protein [Candidatus Dojkabacteria bacterium]|nr:SdpI family protein [Candidatus Dojkabacteria bacterium]